ncbi:hypothetical protein PsAD13_04657 [Pseudovibrio sp. Ad13]|nr:hypothetical protein PsAD13_04657 [Pseudovibrio sp. Ad13]
MELFGSVEDDWILFRLDIVAVTFGLGTELHQLGVAIGGELVNLVGATVSKPAAFREAGQISGLDVPDTVEDHVGVVVTFVFWAFKGQQLGVVGLTGVYTDVEVGHVVKVVGAHELQHLHVLAELQCIVAGQVVGVFPITGIGCIQHVYVAVQD